MELSCYMVDDYQYSLDLLNYYITNTPGLKVIGQDTDSEKALSKLMLQEISPDIVFLDIEMPKVSGLDIARIIQGKTGIIFTTAKREFAQESYEVEAIDYLVKPFAFEKFQSSIKKAFHSISLRSGATVQTEPEVLFIPGNGKNESIKIVHRDISYIKASSNYSDLYMVNDKVYYTFFGLGDLEISLPKSSFIRVHKSYIVNLHHIAKINNDLIFMEGKGEIPISDTYKKAFWDKITPPGKR